ncbi:beta-L-arabinofuranosidase domain-containing protein [Sphaerisporangium sp. TRM90804]|uniref:glycoside hydrolase family 127 protein n=1 Tax=Sphaerisporangium sp. TRM90804 TaxID=3031113 RepID=UPI002447EB7C|nr:beta-L-arabinofuranosidase domain-containing protein [Sphaerisporangium sp. TRM90804]MDH2426915.1 glycoside hydrolase family 127 protein [Sphaerisporangium sp. TRM90804]
MTEQKLSDMPAPPGGATAQASPAPRGPAGPVVPGPGAVAALRPLGLDQVLLHPEGLLGRWRRRNAEQTLPHCVENLYGKGNIGNLQAAAGEGRRPFAGMWFADSDVHKTLEAALWELGTSPGDARLREFVETTAELLARAQQPDGYLNSYFTIAEPDARWRRPNWSHELYCAGHLIQAGVAAGRVGAHPGVLSIARCFANLLVERFGPEGVEEVCGHPEIETALAELYRLTGHRPYLDLARRFLDLRGRGLLGEGRFGPRYYQDHVPVREAREVAGHAVRQLYLLAGMTDVAMETGDLALLGAAERLWDDAFTTRTHVTGAHGSRHREEAYGDPYELPPDRAYGETCAAIASFHWNWRLLLATGRARYADEMERVLHNAVAPAVSTDGRRFFYSNPLQSRTGHEGSGEEAASRRLPWYSCACCPPNIARLMASLPGYLATADDAGLQVHLYGDASLTTAVAGRAVRVEMRTAYPWQGRVELSVHGDDARGGAPWTLALRVPGWCEAYTVSVDGERVPAPARDGYVRLTREWTPGTRVVLDLDLPVRQIRAHPRVDAVRGCVALARGPLVYCVEQADLPSGTVLEDVRLDPSAAITAGHRPDLPDIPVVLGARGLLADADDALYTAGTGRERTGSPLTFTAVPYFLWGNRSEGPMRVWVPVTTAG